MARDGEVRTKQHTQDSREGLKKGPWKGVVRGNASDRLCGPHLPQILDFYEIYGTLTSLSIKTISDLKVKNLQNLNCTYIFNINVFLPQLHLQVESLFYHTLRLVCPSLMHRPHELQPRDT